MTYQVDEKTHHPPFMNPGHIITKYVAGNKRYCLKLPNYCDLNYSLSLVWLFVFVNM